MGSFESLAEALKGYLQDAGISNRVNQEQVISKWPDYVGERVASATKPLRFDEKTLIVEVATAAWRNELTYMKDQILSRIREDGFREIVSDIKFV